MSGRDADAAAIPTLRGLTQFGKVRASTTEPEPEVEPAPTEEPVG